MNKEQLNGYLIAKNGFLNEDDIVNKFNNWKVDLEAKIWLKIMEYDINLIEDVKAIKIHSFKTDVQIQVSIKFIDVLDVQNLQVKLVSNTKGYNQIDKRWIDKYIELWQIPEDITYILKLYTGEIMPNIQNPKDKRRMFMNEFTLSDQEKLIKWLSENKSLIINDIMKGRGKLAAEWILVAQKIENNSRWILKAMNICINYYSQGNIEITKQGNIKIGKITIQRKGGDNGRDTANMLQFKYNPAELFDI